MVGKPNFLSNNTVAKFCYDLKTSFHFPNVENMLYEKGLRRAKYSDFRIFAKFETRSISRQNCFAKVLQKCEEINFKTGEAKKVHFEVKNVCFEVKNVHFEVKNVCFEVFRVSQNLKHGIFRIYWIYRIKIEFLFSWNTRSDSKIRLRVRNAGIVWCLNFQKNIYMRILALHYYVDFLV